MQIETECELLNTITNDLVFGLRALVRCLKQAADRLRTLYK